MTYNSFRPPWAEFRQVCSWFGDAKGVTGQLECFCADTTIAVFHKLVGDRCANILMTERVWVRA